MTNTGKVPVVEVEPEDPDVFEAGGKIIGIPLGVVGCAGGMFPPGRVVVVVPPGCVVVVVPPPPLVVVVVVLNGQIIGSVKSSVLLKVKSEPANVSRIFTSSALVASVKGNVTKSWTDPSGSTVTGLVAMDPFPLAVSKPDPT